MKLLFDENRSPKLTQRLAVLYPGSISVLEQGWGSRTDREIFQHAVEHGFMVVSHDRDFEELALLQAEGGKVILLSGGNLSTSETERLLRMFFEQVEAFALDSSQHVLELR